MRTATRPLAAMLLLGLVSLPVGAFHCPALVKECQALVGKMEAKAGVDKTALAEAKAACAEAMELHNAGDHKASVIKAGEAIAAAGAAAK